MLSIFDRFSGKKTHSNTNYGHEVCQLILNFLKNNDNLKSNAYTFTEMFAFFYIMIDIAMYSRKIPTRDMISGKIIKSHEIATMALTKQEDVTKFLEAFDARVNEYTLILREGKEPSDMIEKLDRYLNHASGLNEFYVGGSAVLIGDAYNHFQNRLALSEFHVHKLLPFIEDIIIKESQ